MAVFDNLKSKNIDELAEWLDEHCWHDNAPWMIWFNKHYCSQCSPVSIDGDGWGDYCWCEIHGKCKYFLELDEAPDCKQIVKLWLGSECEDDDEID